ncbi:hypothetical protein M0805_002627 [Coniferiporia weirii]|nr:hypothetical protein M0805_002627 [Coniferiporia weirii]
MATVVSAGNAERKKIKIDVTSDSICPFCFIGKRKLDRAIVIAKEKGLNLDFEVEYHPYLLDPSLTLDTPIDRRVRAKRKFGKDRGVMMEKMMIARGKEVGLNFSYDGKIRQTTDSHRLFALAYEKGEMTMQDDLVERIFNGFFERDQDIGDRDFLSAQAVAADLFSSAEEATAWLDTDDKKEEVQNGIRHAQKQGITGVPFFVLNNKYAISGAEDSALFVEVFERFCGQPCAQNGRLPSDLVCE